jgi:NAD+ diphosphatase
MYSALAGFVDPGESLEEGIRREIKEEVGIEVKNIQYFKSQPWLFPDSLMIAFTAEYAVGEISIDKNEIEDSSWYSPDEFPPLPGKFSVARALIDHFVNRKTPSP